MGQAICDATALYYASSHLSRLAGNLPSQEALQSEATLCRELNKRISCVDTQADDCSIIAVLGLIAADVQLWSQVCSWDELFVGADKYRTVRSKYAHD
jgi:hypothetical protein